MKAKILWNQFVLQPACNRYKTKIESIHEKFKNDKPKLAESLASDPDLKMMEEEIFKVIMPILNKELEKNKYVAGIDGYDLMTLADIYIYCEL